MAKLSARGRIELARVKRTRPRRSGFDGIVRTELTLMSDGVVLSKYTWLKSDGRVDFDGGWKVKTKLTPTARKKLTLGDAPALIEQWVSQYEQQGYERA